MRGDKIYPAGVIRLGDVIACFPFEDPCVVIRVRGTALWAALENSVSKLPSLEGRFCQVSGIEFAYNPESPEGKRVRWVKVGGQDLDPERRYTIATRGYMARGKDGFESLNHERDDVDEVISEEHGVLISMIIRQYFLSLKIISQWRRGASISKLFSGLRVKQVGQGDLSPKTDTPPAVDGTTGHAETSDEEDDMVEAECSSPVKEKRSSTEQMRLFQLKQRVAKKWEILARMGANARRNGDVKVRVDWCRSVRPTVEGRIKIVTD